MTDKLRPLFDGDDFFKIMAEINPIPGESDSWDCIAAKASEFHELRCPYKPRIDNDSGNEYSMVMALKEENARLREALKRTIRRFVSLYLLEVHVAESSAYADEARAALEEK